MADDLVKTLTDYSDTVKGAIRGTFDKVAQVGGAVNDFLSTTKSPSGKNQDGYNRDGTPPEVPVQKVDDSIKKKAF
jgi:hypothetical protein